MEFIRLLIGSYFLKMQMCYRRLYNMSLEILHTDSKNIDLIM